MYQVSVRNFLVLPTDITRRKKHKTENIVSK